MLCWKTATEKDLELLHSFISNAIVYELEKDIKIKTVELRKQYKIKLPDAIIAATALVSDLQLITRNTADFKDLRKLQLLNP